MARIRHLAIKTVDPKRLAKFYCEAFGLKVLKDKGNDKPIYLTDGYLILALLKVRPGDVPPGLNHFGISVDDVEAASKRLVDLGYTEPAARPSDRPYAELRAMDPDGNLFDLSGFDEEEYLAVEEQKHEKVNVG
jgi:catechol 2,3-dioxygenase-like lactoylglutathione lyase family enzyme